MTDKPPFDRPTPQTREEALEYIAALQAQFEIEDGEDFLLNVIEAQDQKHAEQFKALLHQVAGTLMTVTSVNQIVLDMQLLTDRPPYNVVAEDMPNGKIKLKLMK